MTIQEILNQLNALFKEKKFEVIKEQGEDFLDEFPNEIDLYLLVGKACLATNELTNADYYFLKAHFLDKTNFKPLYLLGALKAAMKQYIEAQEYYEQILDLDSNEVLAVTCIADMYYVCQQFSAASEKYSRALEMGIKDKITLDEYALIIYKAVSSFLADKATTQALALIDTYELETFQEMVLLAKRKAYSSLGTAGKEDILACTETLHANVPNEVSYILDLIQYLDNYEFSARIETLYTKALQSEPTEDQKINVLLGRSDLRMDAENWKGALDDLEALISIKEDWFYYQNRAKVKQHLKEYKGALTDVTKAMQLLDRPNKSLLTFRGELLFKFEKFDTAIKDFNAILSMYPNDSTTYYNLGRIYNKQKDKSSSVKMLMKAEILGHQKANEFLLKNYPQVLEKSYAKSLAKFAEGYQSEISRNKKSPILSKAFDKLWLPDMAKFLLSIEEEIKTYPGTLIKKVLADTAKDMFIITENGILFFEGDEAPLEAYYKVELESEYSILLEIQPTKGGQTSTMRLALFEDNLLVSYPITEVEVQPKYFLATTEISPEQKSRLTTKVVERPYIESIENSIEKL
jgi:tetratricopeptide (TPR) repeat protein